MIQNININRLLPHSNNPRKDLGELTELADNIRINGIYQNLTVVPVDAALYQKKIASKKAYTGDYVIVIGHRRHAAAKMAALSEVPCVVALMDEKTQLSTMMCENIQRSDLTLYEQAQGFQLMLDLGETTSSISELTGLSKTTISKRVKLLALDSEEFQKAEERGATLDDFAKLDKIKDVSLKNEVLEHIGTNNFNWKLGNALDKEKRLQKIARMAEKARLFSEEIKDTDGYEYHESIGVYQENPEDKINKPADADTVKYYFIATDSMVSILKKASGKKAEPAKVENTKQSRHEQNIVKLKELEKRAFELRLEFVKNYAFKKEHLSEIIAFAVRALYLGAEVNESIITSVLGEDNRKAKPEYILMATTYCALDYTNNSYSTFSGKYTDEESLNLIYSFIETVGYQMSDVEKQLQDGTHELYANE